MRGKRRLSRRPRQQSSEHPHVCGENRRFCSVWPWDSGTSPRMRGKPFVVVVKNFTQRNIPAYAGKTGRYAQQMSKLTGTSPRMRGKLPELAKLFMQLGNIPAYAGKTRDSVLNGPGKKEHPRVCGENFGKAFGNATNRGTSPRMRGKLMLLAVVALNVRNIPAYAGKTPPTGLSKKAPTEHPRVCGENVSKQTNVRVSVGTSPRMRGKR